jgi:hypothetical protein
MLPSRVITRYVGKSRLKIINQTMLRIPNHISELRGLKMWMKTGLLQNVTDIRLQVLTAATMKIIVFWDIGPWGLVEIDRRFRSAYCLPHQGDIYNKHLWNIYEFLPEYTVQFPRGQPVLMMIMLIIMVHITILWEVRTWLACIFPEVAPPISKS